ncbi:MAG: hypothetical protein QGG42_00375 [Phycisphaerae bacterium]|jgi:hypothetical protein|nr:hypothetical protein [Phycisphaerae bacterium]
MDKPMFTKEQMIRIVAEDVSNGKRLSAVRRDLATAGYSPEETHEIITGAVEGRRERREQRESAGLAAGPVIMILGLVIMALTFVSTGSGWAVLVPGGLFAYGGYVWHGKPGSE